MPLLTRRTARAHATRPPTSSLTLRSASPQRRSRRLLATLAAATLTVAGFTTASPATAAPEEALPNLDTTTTLAPVATPLVHGESTMLTMTVSYRGETPVPWDFFDLLVDGVVVAEGFVYPGLPGGLWGFAELPGTLEAGEHTVVARYRGAASPGPGFPGLNGSDSLPQTVTVARVTTATEITRSPQVAHAYDPVRVSAHVTTTPTFPPPGSGLPGSRGTVQLRANGTPIAERELTDTGHVDFFPVRFSPDTAVLTVAYLGSGNGSVAPSASAPTPIVIRESLTETRLSLERSDLRADASLDLTVDVRNAAPGVLADPRGGIEILSGTTVVHSVPTATDISGTADTGSARFGVTFDPSQLPLGDSDLTARFVPIAGFAASESDPEPLRLRGIDTQLTVASEDLTGTPDRAATVEVAAAVVPEAATGAPAPTEGAAATRRVAGPGDNGGEGASGDGPERGAMSERGATSGSGAGVAGTVQAFAAGSAIGAPVDLADGAGTVELEGLGVGTHAVELRFTPDSPRMLGSSVEVTVTVTSADGDGADGDGADGDGDGAADGDSDIPDTGGGSSPGGTSVMDGSPAGGGADGRAGGGVSAGTLSVTGGAAPALAAVGGLVLLLGAGIIAVNLRTRSRNGTGAE